MPKIHNGHELKGLTLRTKNQGNTFDVGASVMSATPQHTMKFLSQMMAISRFSPKKK
jgi:hypothetical protein